MEKKRKHSASFIEDQSVPGTSNMAESPVVSATPALPSAGRTAEESVAKPVASGSSQPGCEAVDWSNFGCRKSNSGRYDTDKHGNRDYIMYKHYLPPSESPLLCNKPLTEDNLLENYIEFDTICHVTSLKNATEIIKSGDFKMQVVGDNSVVTGCTQPLTNTDCVQPLHPVNRSRILWYGPWKKKDIGNADALVKRYGNVVFSMKTLGGYEGILRKEFNYYFIEIIKYRTSSACRILVTLNIYSGLRRYVPYKFGGPWYVGESNYFLKNFTLEFMKEDLGHSNIWHYNVWLKNHEISFNYCFDARRGVSAVEQPSMNIEDDFSFQFVRLLFCHGGYYEGIKFGFPEIIDKPYLKKALESLHKRAISQKSNITLNIFDHLMDGFRDQFMDARKDVVDVYELYLESIREYRDATLVDVMRLFNFK